MLLRVSCFCNSLNFSQRIQLIHFTYLSCLSVQHFQVLLLFSVIQLFWQVFSRVVKIIQSENIPRIDEIQMVPEACPLSLDRFLCGIHWYQHEQQKWRKYGAQWFSGEQWYHQDNTSTCSSLQAKGSSTQHSSFLFQVFHRFIVNDLITFCLQ